MKGTGNKRRRIAAFAAIGLLLQAPAGAVDRGVASAVTRLDQQQLQSFDLGNLQQMLQGTPGVTVDEAGKTGTDFRGLQGPGVPVFIDGVRFPRQFGLAIDQPNIERIEVLRGPQGTLFGRTAGTGAVMITTKRGAEVSADRFNPGNTGYAFNNLLRDQYVAIDSVQQCDYTPGIYQPAFSVTPQKLPAAQRQWDQMWDRVELGLRGGADPSVVDSKLSEGSLNWLNGTLYRFPAADPGEQGTEGAPVTQPWFFFSAEEGADFQQKFNSDFEPGGGGPSANGAGGESPWYSEFRGGIPSWDYIRLHSPCSEAMKARLKPIYDRRYQAMADRSYYQSYADEPYRAKKDKDADQALADEAGRQRDLANNEIRDLLRQCPDAGGTADSTTADAGPGDAAGTAAAGAAAAETEPVGNGSRPKYGDIGKLRLEFRLQYRDPDGNERLGEDAMMGIGPHQDFPLPFGDAAKDAETDYGADPVRLFFQDGRGGVDVDDALIGDLGIDPAKITRAYKLSANWAAFTGRTDWDPRWGDAFRPRLDWEDRTTLGGGLDLGWKGGRFELRLDVPYNKYDSRVIEFAGQGDDKVTSPDDLSEDFLKGLDVGVRTRINDAFSINTKVYLSVLYPENSGLNEGTFDAIPGQTGHENNVCAEEALPPPGDPAFKGSGAWGQDYDDQWAIKRVGFTDDPTSAWFAVNGNARPVVIGVIDTGLDWHHLEINWKNLWRNEGEIPGNFIDDDGNGYVDDIIGWDFLNNGNEPWDYDGHGTFVTGIIVADRDNGAGIAGINPKAKIMVLKALNSFGHTRASHIAKAIVYGADNGAQILNLSVAGPGLPRVVQAAVQYAQAKGVLVVAAAGNLGESTDNVEPAGVPGVLTVAATNLNDQRALFSNYGTQVDIAAPGIEIMSLRARRTDFMWNTPDESQYRPGDAYVGKDKRYYRSAGTSFAAPIVSGVASLVWSHEPALSADEVRRVLEQSARDIETPGRDQYSGYGLVDARAALAMDPRFFVDVLITDAAAVEEGGEVYLEVYGSLDADRLKRGWLEYGPGENPSRWRRVQGELRQPVRDGALGRIPARDLSGSSTWMLRLIGEHEDGERREYRFQVDLG